MSGLAAIHKRAERLIPNWLGFGLIILAGLVGVVIGAVQENAGLISFGVAAVASAIIGWVSGARSSPRVNPLKKSFGGTVKQIKQVPWVLIAALFVVAIVVAVLTSA